jgi:hypothetical protein
MILEALNRQNIEEGFPMTLFGAMWLLPVLFFILLMPLLRSARSGKGLMAKPVPFLFGVAFLALLAVLWTATVIDQMPCFLGVPLCD